jgi:Phosphotransferase enzyme family
MPDVVECARRALWEEGSGPRAEAGGPRAIVVGVRERPDSTIRIIQVGEVPDRPRFFLKTLRATPQTRAEKRDAIMTEYRILATLREQFAGLPYLTVVRPVACFAEELSLLTEEWPGRGLDTVLGGVGGVRGRKRREETARQCELAGEWLKHFQSFTVPEEPRTFDLAELFQYCEERLNLVRGAGARQLDGDTAVRVRRRLERLAVDVDRGELAVSGQHNDFRPENMLGDGSRLALLDFTGFRHGTRLYDFMKFWLKLEDVEGSVFGRGREVSELQTAFRAGYGLGADPRGPLGMLIRAAFVLDKLSEAVDPDLPRAPLGRRAVLNQWYRRQRRWLVDFTEGGYSK